MKNLTLFSFLVLGFFASCQQKDTLPETLPMQVAKAYGFENWDQIKSIGYTWNVQRDSAYGGIPNLEMEYPRQHRILFWCRHQLYLQPSGRFPTEAGRGIYQ